LAFFKKISGGFFGGFGEKSAFCYFRSFVTTWYHAGYEVNKLGADEKPTSNFLNLALAQLLAAA